MGLTRFALLYLLYTAVLAVIAYFLPFIFPGTVILVKKFWVIFGVFAIITFIAYVCADLGIKHHPESGIMAIMSSIAIKMVFLMAFVLVYSLKSEEKGLIFFLNFFSLYLLFSFFEIYCLLRNLRDQNK